MSVGEQGVAGLMSLPVPAREGGAPPRWVGYISVEDIAAATQRLRGAGGTIHKEPEPIPGVGHFAVVTDPQGALFVLFQPDAGMTPTLPAPGMPGTVGWHELHAADGQAAFDFYSGQFGWTEDGAVDMGPMGTYQLFAIDGVQSGGMMTDLTFAGRPMWLTYFNVADIEAATERVRAAAGQVSSGPHPVPGGRWVAHCRDPQGAAFAIVGPAG